LWLQLRYKATDRSWWSFEAAMQKCSSGQCPGPQPDAFSMLLKNGCTVVFCNAPASVDRELVWSLGCLGTVSTRDTGKGRPSVLNSDEFLPCFVALKQSRGALGVVAMKKDIHPSYFEESRVRQACATVTNVSMYFFDYIRCSRGFGRVELFLHSVLLSCVLACVCPRSVRVRASVDFCLISRECKRR
jgi:hypothetical protein